MKNIMLMFLLMIGLNVNAQSDAFFSYQYGYRDNENEEWSEVLLLPKTHGLDYNYPAHDAPLSSGLFMLIGLGLGYVFLRERS